MSKVQWNTQSWASQFRIKEDSDQQDFGILRNVYIQQRLTFDYPTRITSDFWPNWWYLKAPWSEVSLYMCQQCSALTVHRPYQVVTDLKTSGPDKWTLCCRNLDVLLSEIIRRSGSGAMHISLIVRTWYRFACSRHDFESRSIWSCVSRRFVDTQVRPE